MNFTDFAQKFSTEEQCVEFLIQYRWPEGWHCSKCSCKEYYYQTSRKSFKCKQCSDQQSITAGTIFHKSKVPLQKWFLAIFLLAQDEGNLSTLVLQNQLSLPHASTAHRLKSKILSAFTENTDLFGLQNFF